jgi:hypothetical protein
VAAQATTSAKSSVPWKRGSYPPRFHFQRNRTANSLLDLCRARPNAGRKAVAPYHLFFLNYKNEITGTATLQCEADEQAIAEARSRARGRRFVVWHGSRLVGVFEDLVI